MGTSPCTFWKNSLCSEWDKSLLFMSCLLIGGETRWKIICTVLSNKDNNKRKENNEEEWGNITTMFWKLLSAHLPQVEWTKQSGFLMVFLTVFEVHFCLLNHCTLNYGEKLKQNPLSTEKIINCHYTICWALIVFL